MQSNILKETIGIFRSFFKFVLIFRSFFYLALISLVFFSCERKPIIIDKEEEHKGTADTTDVQGFYLLNEGGMGRNNATLDYYSYDSAVYYRNIYASVNPSVVMELGDVGNDLKIYGSKLYAVINASNKVEVMDAKTAKRIGQIDIPNCRYIAFHNGYLYITSYAGQIELGTNYQRGFVAKIDTGTLQITAQCNVGYQPDGLATTGNKLYVANSGGYNLKQGENTLSVIDLTTFTEIKKIKIAPNLNRICADKYGKLWVCSRGNYTTISSKLYVINSDTDELCDSLNIATSNFYLHGDSLYICNVEWSNISMSDEVSYGIVNVALKQIVTRNFITDNTNIEIPYGIMIHPTTGDIYIADAADYVLSGTLYCFGKDGKQKWNVRTGVVPSSFALLYKNS